MLKKILLYLSILSILIGLIPFKVTAKTLNLANELEKNKVGTTHSFTLKNDKVDYEVIKMTRQYMSTKRMVRGSALKNTPTNPDPDFYKRIKQDVKIKFHFTSWFLNENQKQEFDFPGIFPNGLPITLSYQYGGQKYSKSFVFTHDMFKQMVANDGELGKDSYSDIQIIFQDVPVYEDNGKSISYELSIDAPEDINIRAFYENTTGKYSQDDKATTITFYIQQVANTEIKVKYVGLSNDEQILEKQRIMAWYHHGGADIEFELPLYGDQTLLMREDIGDGTAEVEDNFDDDGQRVEIDERYIVKVDDKMYTKAPLKTSIDTNGRKFLIESKYDLAKGALVTLTKVMQVTFKLKDSDIKNGAKWDDNSTTPQVKEAIWKQAVNQPQPVYDSKVFQGWSKSNTATVADSTIDLSSISEDITLYAVFSDKYNISFVADDDKIVTFKTDKSGLVTPGQSLKEAGISLPEKDKDYTIRRGYKVVNWVAGDIDYADTLVPDSNLTFKAVVAVDETVNDFQGKVNYYIADTTDKVPGIAENPKIFTGYINQEVAIVPFPEVVGYTVLPNQATNIIIKEDNTAEINIYYAAPTMEFEDVRYQFVSADANQALPLEVRKLVPNGANFNYEYGLESVLVGSTKTPAGFDRVSVADGEWQFEGWKPSSVTIVKNGGTFDYKDVTTGTLKKVYNFIGTWKFIKKEPKPVVPGIIPLPMPQPTPQIIPEKPQAKLPKTGAYR